MTFYMNDRRKLGYVPGRDPLVDEVMRGWQKKYCTFNNMSLCVSTFNVNGKSPPEQISEWFPSEKVSDLYAIGLQEMDLSVGTYIMDNNKKLNEWMRVIHNNLPGGQSKFKIIATSRLIGIFIVLFIRADSKVRISQTQATYTPTGFSVLGSKLGNKGGTAISVKLNDTLLCFINSHFAAGNNELDRRNQDYREISQAQFENGLSIYDHDAVFWFGDLNYRINTDDIGFSGDKVREIASGNEFQTLLAFDQLREQQDKGRIFVGFQEASVLNFRPTYKYDAGSVDIWDTSEKARIPAWCDRILFWSREHDVNIRTHIYESVPSITLSDHKPVRAIFSVVVKNIDKQKAEDFHEAAIREADKRANDLLPQVKLSEHEIDFGEVKYLQPVTRTITITNIGKSTVRFKFLVRPTGGASAKWLQVTPPHFAINVGCGTQISLTVTIDKDIVGTLEETNLQDILVMNLENGRDHFIPVTAKYFPKCFGVTLKALLSNKKKKSENLIDFGDSNDCIDNCPEFLPREIYRLVMALHERGIQALHHINLNNTSLSSSDFYLVRNAIEEDFPKNLTELRVPTFALYNTLIRLIESLKDPIIPKNKQADFKQTSDPGRLWALVNTLPSVNAATLEYLLGLLTAIVRSNNLAEEFLMSWADILFGDVQRKDQFNLISTDPRILALRSMCDYSKDVSICHAYSTSRLYP